MASPPGVTLEEFKARLPLVDVVGRWVKLARRGREHWGCCPFHKEKSPSFHVVGERGFYHCFGCGAHGNAIDFVMAVEGLDFGGALERLADLTGIPAPRREGPAKPRAEPGLYEAQEAAVAWFRQQLAEPAGRAAAAYLERRGVTPELAARFRLGYAPNDRTALKRALVAQGFAADLLVRAGLLIAPEDGGDSFDRFRDRVMFPIEDARGRAVGFGGRALGEAKAKYLNSPETELFHKGRMLYNQARAQQPARAAGTLLVVEGYMDVIGLARAGIDHVVAPLGTAVTEEQLAELWRHAAEPVFCLDGDAAGLRAAGRAADRALPLLQAGRSLRFVILPPGEDPDSLVQSQGADAARAALADTVPLVEFLWRQAVAGVPLDTPERRAAVERDLMARLATIGDATLRTHYRRELGQRLRDLWRPPARGKAGRPAGPVLAPVSASPQLAAIARRADRRAEETLLEPFLLNPGLLRDLEEELARLQLDDLELDRLRGEILGWYAGDPPLDADDLRAHLTAHGFGPLFEHILRLRLRARAVSRQDAEDDVQGAWRSAAARHGRSVARGAGGAGSASHVVDEQQSDVISRIGTLNRLLDDAGRPRLGRRSSGGDAS